MQQTVFITGNSSGLGYGLSEGYLDQGWRVYGLSRRGCLGLDGDLHDIECDLNERHSIAPALVNLLAGVSQLDVVYLNAGIFGELNRITDITLEQIERIMNINVWANKIILDWLFSSDISVKQVIAISSGAAVSASKGWACYSLSKVTLHKLIEHYATEFTDTHFCSLAPGLVDTAMQDYLCDDEGILIDQFPALQKFREARGTDMMPSPLTAAKSIIALTSSLLKLPSGRYADIRKI